MATLPLKSSRNKQRAVIRFFCGQKDLMQMRFTLRCVQCMGQVFYETSNNNKVVPGGQKFASDTEVQSVVRQWLGQQPASFFASGIQKLVDRWDKCLNERGRYVKK